MSDELRNIEAMYMASTDKEVGASKRSTLHGEAIIDTI
jgi:hypothetical protein